MKTEDNITSSSSSCCHHQILYYAMVKSCTIDFINHTNKGVKYSVVKHQLHACSNISNAIPQKGRGKKHRIGQKKMKSAICIVSHRVRDISQLDSKCYVYKEWERSATNAISPEETVPIENINEYTIHNSIEEQDLVVQDTEGKLIVAKLSRWKARCMGGNKKWRQVRNLMEAVVKHKPNVKCGDRNGGKYSHYKCFGFRKDPLKSGVLGQYTFKPKTPTEIERRIGRDISVLVQNMESASMLLVGGMNEHTNFKKLENCWKFHQLQAQRREYQHSLVLE